MSNNFNQIKGLFLNTKKASCSIYESGLMIYKALILSELYHLDYLEIDQNDCNISDKYDFYVFNYHHTAMGWLDTSNLKEKLSGLKATLVLEISPNDPFILCPKNDFDVYCAIDPTINIDDKRVYSFPRPLETFENIISYEDKEIPVIGTFGFATVGKGFELVVEAVNREFEEAVVRINIPPAIYADNIFWNLHKRNYAEHLSDLCKKVAKPNIQVIVSHDYMSKEDLVNWCSQNTLNCFLYNRNQPGLSATTDQAISSGRPLAISNNPTFRHIHPYIKPYPYQTLKDSIKLSQDKVVKIQKDWHPINFAKKFESILEDNQIFTHQAKHVERLVELDSRKVVKPKTQPSTLQKLISKIERKSTNILENLGYKKRKKTPPSISVSTSVLQSTPLAEINNKILSIKVENTILIVSHKQKNCGIYQYGINITRALQKSSRYSFIYVECSNEIELEEYIRQNNPSVIIYNYYPATMPWLNSQITRNYKAIQMGIMHEVTQEEADKATQEMFDYHLSPNPTLVENNPNVIRIPRLIIPYINSTFAPEITTIGIFGFEPSTTRFDRLIKQLQNEFDQPRILLYIPLHKTTDSESSLNTLHNVEVYKGLAKNSSIDLIISYNSLETHQLLDLLASSSLNVIFQNDTYPCVSNLIEYALSSQTSFTILTCDDKFYSLSSNNKYIFVEVESLNKVVCDKIIPFVPFYNKWSEDNFILFFTNLLDEKIKLLHLNNQVNQNTVLIDR